MNNADKLLAYAHHFLAAAQAKKASLEQQLKIQHASIAKWEAEIQNLQASLAPSSANEVKE